jgi:hypothetical protein
MFVRRIIICLVVFFSLLKGQNDFLIKDISGKPGDTLTVAVLINNKDPFVGFQFSVPQPDQIRLLPNTARLSPRSQDHILSASMNTSSVMTIFAYSMSQAIFHGDSGAVCYFNVVLDSMPGTYELEFIDPVIGNSNAQNIVSNTYSGSVTIRFPKIKVVPDTLDFGIITDDSPVDTVISIYNMGNDSLKISRIYTSSPFFSIIGDTSFTLIPGDSSIHTIRFFPDTLAEYSGTLFIVSNDLKNSISAVHMVAKKSVFASSPHNTLNRGFELYDNYPNPFNSSTNINYKILQITNITLRIYNVQGQSICEIKIKNLQPGYYSYHWEGINKNGLPVCSGLYFYQLVAGDYVDMKKMVLLK